MNDETDSALQLARKVVAEYWVNHTSSSEAAAAHTV